MRRYVLATAGHVDHGKSTLVRALTGMEPDRFAEERRRGLTIDLGFAWMTLPSGAQLAFVDVPGHERFIANMLAGVGAAPAVLFVVAADAGWSRQSSEHLAAIDALQVRHGLLAVTRSDLADPEPARRDALARIASSSFGTVGSVAVSGTTGDGLVELRTALDDLAGSLPAADDKAPVRLWLDRSFSVRGAGTVVTGTLAGGTLTVGDTLELDGRPLWVRGLQSAGADVETITGTARVAINLRDVSAEAIGRGDVLLTPDAWWTTAVLDVRLSTPASELPAELMLHAGTAAVPARVRPLDERHARLTLARALPLRAGDRAVLRDPGRHAVAAGVLVLDADPPSLRRRAMSRTWAQSLSTRTGAPDAAAEVTRRGVVQRAHLSQLGIDSAELADIGGWLVDPETSVRWTAEAADVVDGWARAHPLEPAMPTAAFSRQLTLPPDATLLASVASSAGLQVSGGRVSRPEVTAELGPGVAGVVARLRARPFDAPTADELAEAGLGRRELAAAVKAGALLDLDGVVLLPDVASPARVALAALGTSPDGFTLSEARQALGTTRRVAVPLLEHLDRVGMTRSLDHAHRVLVRSASSQWEQS